MSSQFQTSYRYIQVLLTVFLLMAMRMQFTPAAELQNPYSTISIDDAIKIMNTPVKKMQGGIQVTYVADTSLLKTWGMIGKKQVSNPREFIILVDGKPITKKRTGGYTIDAEVYNKVLVQTRLRPLHLITARTEGPYGLKVLCSYLLPPGETGIALSDQPRPAFTMPEHISYLEFTPDALLKTGDAAKEKGNTDTALKTYKQVSLWYPLSDQAKTAKQKRKDVQNEIDSIQIQTLTAQAENYQEQNDFDHAATCYEQILKNYPDYTGRDQVITKLAELKNAKTTHTETEQQNKYDALVKEGDLALEQKLYTKAIKSFTDALAIKSDSATKGKLDQAQTLHLESLEKSRLQEKAKQEELAKAEQDKRLRQEKENEIAMQKYADAIQAHLKAGNLETARQELSKMQEAFVDHPMINAMQTQIQKAEKEQKLELRLKKADGLVETASFHIGKEQYDEALEACAQALRMVPDHEGAQELINELRKLPEIMKAITTLKNAETLIGNTLQLDDFLKDPQNCNGQVYSFMLCRIIDVPAKGQAILTCTRSPLPIIIDCSKSAFPDYPLVVNQHVNVIIKSLGIKQYESQAGPRNALLGEVIWIGKKVRTPYTPKFMRR